MSRPVDDRAHGNVEVDTLDPRRRARGRLGRRRDPRRRRVRALAGRRRARARPAARLVDRPRPRTRRGRRAGQHRARPARPRPLAAALCRHGIRPHAKTTSPTGATSPSSAAPGCSSSRTATSPTRSCASSSPPSTFEALYRLRRRLDGRRPSRRSRRRPSRRSTTTATTPSSGCCGSRSAPTNRAAAPSVALADLWPYLDELFAGRAAHRPARDRSRSARRRCGSAFDGRGRDGAPGVRARRSRRSRSPRAAVARGQHSSYLGYLLAEMQVLARRHPGATW